MTNTDLFVTFGIPAIAVTLAYAAVRANEWAIRRDRQSRPE